MSLAVTKRKKSIIILAWIAPIIAIIISASMVYDYYTKDGHSVQITFNNIDGLDLRQSHIQYNGLHIGDITSMNLDRQNLKKFIITAKIYTQYNYLIKEGSIFYKVSPQLSLNEVSGLGNILKGNYIELLPPTQNIKELEKKKQKFIFEGYDQKPKKSGVIFNINANEGEFSIGSSIVFKGLPIGEIIKKKIEQYNIVYKVLIYDKYKYLISSSTKFYQINPFEFNASFENINIKIPSIKNILSSAIGFVTPSYDDNIKTNYKLYKSENIIEKDNHNKDYYNFQIKANNIAKNDLVIYKGIIVGRIEKVELKTDLNIVSGNIYSNYTYLINNSTYFYKPKALTTKLSTEGLKLEIPTLKELLQGGLTFTTPVKNRKLSNTTFTYYEDKDTFFESEKFTITLNLKDNYNIKTTSKLYYKNIAIAKVKEINLNKNIQVIIESETKYKYLFGKNAKIYLEGTQVSLNGIKNISSAVLGDNLHLIADESKSFKKHFTLDSINPDSTHYKKGLRVALKANNSKNITIGSPIYYKGFEVGEIYDAKLMNDGEYILFNLFIEDKYRKILKTSSSFFKATIIDMDVGVLGAKIKMGSAKSMLKGGIYFQNISTSKKTVEANTNTIFYLKEKEK